MASIWAWKVKLPDGREDFVELRFSLLGQEVLRLNGRLISDNYNFFPTGQYSIQLADGSKGYLSTQGSLGIYGIPSAHFMVNEKEVQPTVGPSHIVLRHQFPKWGILWYLAADAILAVAFLHLIALPFAFLVAVGAHLLLREILVISDSGRRWTMATMTVVLAWILSLGFVGLMIYLKIKNPHQFF